MALYLDHFGLTEPPFRITPHTDFFFDGADRGATLEALIYAIVHDEGIVKVSGEVGSGKTMLCRVLMERLPARVETIYLATPSFAREEILQAIADDLDLKFSQDRMTVAIRELQDCLIRLYAAGRRVVILVDEAHVMPEDTLEQIRLLSNLESNRHKLLQIVLFGQPELDATLAKPSLRQLRDRITHSFRTRPLSMPEVSRYLTFRMRAAGYRGPEVFTPRAATMLARASGGLSRRINILADKALLSAFTENTHAVTERHVRAAIKDSEFSSARRVPRPVVYAGAALAAGVALGIAFHGAFTKLQDPATPVASVIAQTPTESRSESSTPRREPALTFAQWYEDDGAVAEVQDAEAELADAESARLSDDRLRRFDAYSTGGQKLLSERVAAARALLDHAPDEHYAIELFVTDNPDPKRMERFLQRARDWVSIDQVFVVPMPGAKRPRLRVLYGDFESEKAAQEAMKRLPPRYQQAFRAAPRSAAELRRQI